MPSRSPLALLTLLFLLALPTVAVATAYELSRIASELTHVSQQMAHELRGGFGYSSIRFSADRLAQEAEQLVEAISRGRNSSHVRRQVDDVRRRYLELEEAVLRLDNDDQSQMLLARMDRVSALYESMNAEFYYTGRQFPPQYQQLPQPIIVLPQTRHAPRYPLQPTQVQPGHSHERSQARPNRFDYGRITTYRQQGSIHRSKVLERQSRQRQQLDLHGSGERYGIRRTETSRGNHHDASNRD
ncbi:MAG: hypothetical protein PsegKO_16500 [Pseudohongiellaceae bacterium]